METFYDCFGRAVRLTSERFEHMLEHSEMVGLEHEIELVLRYLEFVRRSRSDPQVALLYRYYLSTMVGGKWLCVVVKYLENDAFVITAYLTDTPKTGEELWRSK